MSAENVSTESDLPAELSRLVSLIDEKPEAYASGDKDIQEAALTAAKYIFDLTLKSESRAFPHLKDLLDSIGPAEAPQTHAQIRSTSRAEEKRAPPISHAILNTTPLSALFVDGMDDEQIWAQVELKAKNVCDTLDEAFAAGDMTGRDRLDSSDDDDDDELDADELEEMAGMEGLDMSSGEDDVEESNGNDDNSEGSESAEEELEEKITELRDPSSDEEYMEEEEEHTDLDAGPSPRPGLRKNRRKRHAGLDDDFFSLEDFNAEIEEAEAKNVSHGSLSKILDDADSEEEGEIDFFTPLGDNNEKSESAGGEAYYTDFFDPPPGSAHPRKRKASLLPVEPAKRSKVHFNEQVKVKTIKAKGKGLSLSSVDNWIGDALDGAGDDDDDHSDKRDDVGDENVGDFEEEDIDVGSRSESETDRSDVGREAVSRLKDDLFADEDDAEASKSGLSTHEARMEELRRQILELEAENVAEKEWVLKGEVTSRARPQNALLEEDLEFGRVTKAVPVVTEEIVQDLEARIKARIIDGRFDDVIGKRPVDDKAFLPSQVFELQDAKSKESLAQIYENEYIASQSGGSTNDRDARLQKEHEEIEKQWENICYKLDALCNAHFTPKQPKATISTVSNVSAVSLESPLPTAKAASIILAPEEVFEPGSSELRTKSELTPTEKRALRTKERKKRKKQRQVLEKNVDNFARPKGTKSANKEKDDALKSLVKSGKGVTVIGKKSQELKKSKQRS
ncbi:Mpp10 protein [Sanghuangporus baumii]|uniref:U3 small nucleolar ribonucleoprotein protein MPP10 n=1 Tax=Sanghuangporus baumii TaxID=108892 RepID=A0A9Q5HRG5_SANBA|nr:Mpp10 protein [Sanghuangporus baumii]